MKPSGQQTQATPLVPPSDTALRDNNNMDNIRKLSHGMKALQPFDSQEDSDLSEPPPKRTKLELNKSEFRQESQPLKQENVQAVPDSLKEIVSADHRAYLRFGAPKSDLRRLATLNLMARQNAVMVSYEKEKSRKEKEALKLVANVQERVSQKRGLTLHLSQEISRLPAKLFSSVVKNLGAQIDIEHIGNMLNMLSTTIHDDVIEFIQKLQCLAYYALLPHIIGSNGATSIREFYSVYELLVKLNKVVAVEYVLLPMLRAGATVHPSMLQPVDSNSYLLKRILQSFDNNTLQLTDTVINTLKICLEVPRFPASPLDRSLLGAIECAVANNGRRSNLASFIYTILTRFQFTMNASQLTALYKINQLNQTVLREPIKKLLEKRLDDCVKTNPPNRIELQAQAEHMEIE